MGSMVSCQKSPLQARDSRNIELKGGWRRRSRASILVTVCTCVNTHTMAHLSYCVRSGYFDHAKHDLAIKCAIYYNVASIGIVNRNALNNCYILLLTEAFYKKHCETIRKLQNEQEINKGIRT